MDAGRVEKLDDEGQYLKDVREDEAGIMLERGRTYEWN